MNDYKCYNLMEKQCIALSLKNYEFLENDSELLCLKKDDDGILIYFIIKNEKDLFEQGKIEIIKLSENKLYLKNIPAQRIYTYIAQYTNLCNNKTKEITLNDAYFKFENLIKHFNLEKLIKN